MPCLARHPVPEAPCLQVPLLSASSCACHQGEHVVPYAYANDIVGLADLGASCEIDDPSVHMFSLRHKQGFIDVTFVNSLGVLDSCHSCELQATTH